MSLSDSWLIGCRISIISKARIRYEGFLHSVDVENPDDPAITLSKVWSFGTEDRVCERQVAPRNEEYERIMFRGRDLEDVRLVQSSVFLNEDPSIMSAVPASTSSSQPPGLRSTDKQQQGTIKPNLPGTTPASSVGQSLFSSQPLSMESLSQPNFTAPFNFTSNSTLTSTLGNLQLNTSENAEFRGPRPFGDGRNDGSDAGSSSIKRPEISAWNNTNFSTAPDRRQQSSNFDNSQRRNDRGSNFRSGNNQFYGDMGHSYGGSHDNRWMRRGGYNNQWSNHRNAHGSKSAWHPRGGGGGGGYRSGGNNAWRRPQGNDFGGGTKFTGDYDYEKANAELAAELEKISISAKATSNDGETNKEEESVSSNAGEDAGCYDQSKSFFDTISSELLDRAIGRNTQGMNRRDERVLNTATFGTASANWHRRGYGQRGRRSNGRRGPQQQQQQQTRVSAA